MPARHFAINPGFALALIGALAGTAHAQVDSWVAANCTMLQTPARKAVIEMCEGHAGCAIMLSTHKTCLGADKFLEKLDAATPPATPMLFGLFSRRVVTPEAVWEAHLSDAARAVESKPEWKARIDPIVRAIKPGSTDVLSGEFRGVRWVAYGPTENGKSHGYGTSFFSNGQMYRGEESNGVKNGEIDIVFPSGLRTVGTYVKDQISGTVVQIIEGGATEYRGGFSAGLRNGQGVEIRRDGSRSEGTFRDGRFVEGSVFRANGTLESKGTWDAQGKPHIVQTFDEGGQMVSEINAPRAQAEAARAKAEAAERQQREQAAARAAEEQQRREAQARADKEFRDSLASLNAGELFTRSQDLRNAGNTQRAQEMQRYLIERFPNHALAAVAAQQMAAVPSSGAGTPPRAAVANGGVSYQDAIRQLQQAMDKPGNERRFLDTSTGNQVQEQILWVTNYYARAVNQLPQCANDAAYRKRFDNDLAQTRQNCPSRTRGPANCTAGANHYIDERQVQAVFQQLMAAQGTATAGTATASSPAVNAGATAEQACATGISAINDAFSAASAKIPKDSVVVYSEAFMWQLKESIGVVERQCPNSENYRGMAQRFRDTLKLTAQVCDGSSSRGPCVARLPVAETAVRPAPTQVAAQRPLENKPPASCSDTSGANWLACQRQLCAKVSGVLKVSGGCVACQAPGNSFNACLPGQGFNSAQ